MKFSYLIGKNKNTGLTEVSFKPDDLKTTYIFSFNSKEFKEFIKKLMEVKNSNA